MYYVLHYTLEYSSKQDSYDYHFHGTCNLTGSI